MDKTISQSKPQSSNLNQSVLETMAKGPEKERIVCPVCGKPKQTGHLVCQECNRVPGAFQAVKEAVYKLRGQPLPTASSSVRPVTGPVAVTRGLKVEMVQYAIEAINHGIDSGTLPEVMARTEFPRVSLEDRRRAVSDASSAINAVGEIESYIREKEMSLQDIELVVEGFIREKANGRLSSFVVKAAIYCIVLPRLEKTRSFEEKVAYAIAELSSMRLSDAYNTSLVQIRDALVDKFAKGKGSRGFRDFCFAAAREAVKRFEIEHGREWKALVEENARKAKDVVQRRFERRGYRVNRAKVA